MVQDDTHLPALDATIINGDLAADERSDATDLAAPALAAPELRIDEPPPAQLTPGPAGTTAPAPAAGSSVCKTPHLAALAFEGSACPMFLTDRKHRIVLVNRALQAATGYGKDDLVGRQPPVLALDWRSPEEFQEVVDALQHSAGWEGEVQILRADGQFFPALISLAAMRDARGSVLSCVGTMWDVSARRKAEEHLQRLSQYDATTGLANRALLQDRLDQAIASCRRSHSQLAVLFLDIDRFKTVNDSLGPAIGDELLRRAAERLKTCMRDEDTVARLGGNEFVVLLRSLSHVNAAAQVAVKLGQAIHGPYRASGREIAITSSIGISVFPDDGADAHTLIEHAETAMYRAKEYGRNRYVFYQRDMTVNAKERLMLEQSLVHALRQEQFVLHYQPQIEIGSGEIVGAEALIRWRHPQLGLISPDRFIPLAEETGLIRHIGAWVLRAVRADMQALRAAGAPSLRVSMNLSPKQVLRPQHVEALCAAVAAAEFPLSEMQLEIEITESSLQTGEHIQAAANALKALGVKLAIDDFGTGFSSMVALKQLPIDRIKIDRAFVNRLPDDANNVAITTAIIAMAKALDLKVIAEGVETIEQLRFLRGLGCDEAQGHLISRPVPREVFCDLASRNTHLIPQV